MKSRRRSPHSGFEEHTVDRLMASNFSTGLPDILDSVRGFEVRVLVRVFAGLSYAEIAKECLVSEETVRRVYGKAMSRLRHPSRSQFLRDYLDLDLERFVDGGAIFASSLTTVECPLHGLQAMSETAFRCAYCPCEIIDPGERTGLGIRGRHRQYCTPLCRKRAARERARQTAPTQHIDDQPEILEGNQLRP